MLLGNPLLPQLRAHALYSWLASTWARDGNGRAYNTPTLGSELLVDPGIEAWTSGTNATNWLEFTAGSSTVNQETSVVHGGSNAVRLDIDGSASAATLRQVVTATVGDWLQFSAWLRSSIATGKTGRLDMTNSTLVNGSTRQLTDGYIQHTATARATTTGPTPTISRGLSSPSHSLYGDDASCKKLTLSTTLATFEGAFVNRTLAARLYTLATDCAVGVVSQLDSAASPANYVQAWFDGAGNLLFDKVVAGVITNLQSTAVTFVPDALLEIRWPSTTTTEVWYNGAKVGSTQAVSDVGITGNTRYGLFSTHSANLITQVLLDGSLVPLGF